MHVDRILFAACCVRRIVWTQLDELWNDYAQTNAHTYTHIHTPMLHSPAESDVLSCTFPCSHKLRSLSTSLALMYKPSFPPTLSPFCFTVIWMTTILEIDKTWLCECVCSRFSVWSCAVCVFECKVMSVSVNLFVLWEEIETRLQCHFVIAQRVWQHQNTQDKGW